MSSIPKPIGDPKVLQRRMTTNPKFSDVQSVVDTGPSVSAAQRAKEREVSIRPNANEHFRRLRPSRVARHVAEALTPAEPDASPLAEYTGGAAPGPPPLDMLLLDVRDREDYAACHIKTAQHYPAMMLNRSTNQFPPQLLKVKNSENTLIVLYDLEEEVVCGRSAANTFFERGFDNIAIIAGGLKEFVQEHLELVDGPPPCPIRPKPKAPASAARSTARSNASDIASTRGASAVSSHKPKSLASSLARRDDSKTGTWR